MSVSTDGRKNVTVCWTQRGRVMLFLVVASALVGLIMIDEVLLMLAAVGGILMVIARRWAVKNVAGVEVRRELPLSAFSGTRVEVPFLLRCRARKSAAMDLLVETEVNRGRVSRRGWFLRVPTLSPERESARPVQILAPGRGFRDGGGWQLHSSFPGGLFEVQRSGEFDDQWMIYPAPTLPRKLFRLMERARLEQLAMARVQNEASGELHGIRDYQAGDSLKSVHWAASARCSRLMARQWEPPAPQLQRVGLLLHSLAAAGTMTRPGTFEAALRAASGVVRYCQREEIPMFFSADFLGTEVISAPEDAGFSKVLHALALAKRQNGTEIESIRERLRKMAGHCSRIIVIGDAPLGDWQSRIPPLPNGSTAICVSGEQVSTPAAVFSKKRQAGKISREVGSA